MYTEIRTLVAADVETTFLIHSLPLTVVFPYFQSKKFRLNTQTRHQAHLIADALSVGAERAGGARWGRVRRVQGDTYACETDLMA